MTDIFTDEELQAAEDALPQTDDGTPATEVNRDEQGRFAAKEGEPAPDPAATEEKARDAKVPQGALHAERERRKGVEAELKAAQEQLAAIAQMRQKIAERQAAPLPAADDPAALDHLRARVAEQDQAINQFRQDRDNEAINQAEMMQLRDVMAASENDFRAAQPDYDAAIQHVVEARARELQLYGLSPSQIQHTIATEAADITRTAVAQGRNPAELGYQIALSRGYRPAQPEQAQTAPAANDAVAQIAAIARGQAASRSLGEGGGVRTQQLNAEAIASMSPEEFDALYSTPEGKKLIDNL